MRFKNIIKLIVLVMFAFIAVSFSTTKASAQIHYISSNPKSIRGTWYVEKEIDGQDYHMSISFDKKKAVFVDGYGSETGSEIHSIYEKHVKVRKGAFFTPVYSGYHRQNGHNEYFSKPWGTSKSTDPETTYGYGEYRGHETLVMLNNNTGEKVGFFRSERLADKYSDRF